jgi:hypothetical protein
MESAIESKHVLLRAGWQPVSGQAATTHPTTTHPATQPLRCACLWFAADRVVDVQDCAQTACCSRAANWGLVFKLRLEAQFQLLQCACSRARC